MDIFVVVDIVDYLQHCVAEELNLGLLGTSGQIIPAICSYKYLMYSSLIITIRPQYLFQEFFYTQLTCLPSVSMTKLWSLKVPA